MLSQNFKILLTLTICTFSYTTFAESYRGQLHTLHMLISRYHNADTNKFILATLKQEGNEIRPDASVVTLQGIESEQTLSFMADPESRTVAQMRQFHRIALTNSWTLSKKNICQIRIEGEAYQVADPDERTARVKFQVSPNHVQIGCQSGQTYHYTNFIQQGDGGWLSQVSSYKIKS